jgi:hypothetical protein
MSGLQQLGGDRPPLLAERSHEGVESHRSLFSSGRGVIERSWLHQDSGDRLPRCRARQGESDGAGHDECDSARPPGAADRLACLSPAAEAADAFRFRLSFRSL